MRPGKSTPVRPQNTSAPPKKKRPRGCPHDLIFPISLFDCQNVALLSTKSILRYLDRRTVIIEDGIHLAERYGKNRVDKIFG
jgi:hypothetical protein